MKKTPVKKTTKKKLATKPAPKRKPHAMQRADYGKPIDGFFAKQPPALRAILVKLRKLVEEAAPEAEAAIKWGMPVYAVNGKMAVALGGHKAHVNLVLMGASDSFDDPEGRLEGTSTGGRHLKLTSVEQMPSAAVVKKWVKTAVANARKAK